MPRLHQGHKDHTLDWAVGRVDKEWKQMAEIAVRIREGYCNPEWAEKQSKRFTGIFKRLMTDPIDEVKEEARRCSNC